MDDLCVIYLWHKNGASKSHSASWSRSIVLSHWTKYYFPPSNGKVLLKCKLKYCQVLKYKLKNSRIYAEFFCNYRFFTRFNFETQIYRENYINCKGSRWDGWVLPGDKFYFFKYQIFETKAIPNSQCILLRLHINKSFISSFQIF